MKKLAIVFIILSLFFTQGCWSKKELDDIAIVLGAGVDSSGDDKMKVTVQIAHPQAMGGGNQGGGSSNNPPVVVLVNEGSTVFEAVRGFIPFSSRKMFFSHNQVLIVGEELAKKGLQEMIDFFERDPELRVEVPFLVASGQAQDILNLDAKLENSSASAMHKAIITSEKTGFAPHVRFLDFLLNYQTDAASSVVPYITISSTNGHQVYRIRGLAVFKKDRMIGLLNEEEARGFLWLQGNINNAVIIVDNPNEEKGSPISVEITNTITEIKPVFVEGKPQFQVTIKTNGNVGEIGAPLKISDPKIITALEKNMKKEIQQQVDATLEKAQREFKADIFGFGGKIHAGYKEQWKDLRANWEKEFPEVSVQVSVVAQITHSGEKTNPTKPK